MHAVRNLRHLDLSSNQIVTVEGLTGLIHLRTLNLSCNLIEVVQGLRNLRYKLWLKSPCVHTDREVLLSEKLSERNGPIFLPMQLGSVPIFLGRHFIGSLISVSVNIRLDHYKFLS